MGVPNSQPDILVCTPTQLLKNADKFVNSDRESNYIHSYSTIIIDEADLITTFGHSQALSSIVEKHLNKNRQMILLSATLDMEDDEVAELRDLLQLEKPVILALIFTFFRPFTTVQRFLPRKRR